jgi:hypothetical protein
MSDDQSRILCLEKTVRNLEENLKRAFQRNEVRKNMIAVLREMLTTHFKFNIQPIIGNLIQEELLRKENVPSKIEQLAFYWISYHRPLQARNCDFNARFCWATLNGESRAWLDTPSCTDSNFVPDSLEGWMVKRQQWLTSNKTMMIVRLISDGSDGHSVLSYRYDGKVFTFQAYYDISLLKVLEYDIFTKSLIDKLLAKNLVNAIDFGFSSSTKSLTYLSCKYLEK